MASAHLGGLGGDDGPPIYYDWVPPSPIPRLLPWLGMLALLALACNRTAKAWWIWVPLLAITAGESLCRPGLEFLPSSVLSVFCLSFNSLAFGLAALWLLAAHLNHRHQFVVYLKMLGVVAGISALAYLLRADWATPSEAVGFLVFLGICALIAVTGLSLAAWVSRRRYGRSRLVLWLALWVMALWLLTISPLFVLAAATGGAGDWVEFTQILLSFAALTYTVLLSFLVLAFANGFYGRRFTQLLRLDEAVATPPALPSTPADAERAPTVTSDIRIP